MKENIKDNLMNFFIIVTLVNIVIFVCGSIFAPDQEITYSAFLVPIIDGALGIIPGIVMYSKRELTVKQMIVREVIQLLSIRAEQKALAIPTGEERDLASDSAAGKTDASDSEAAREEAPAPRPNHQIFLR